MKSTALLRLAALLGLALPVGVHAGADTFADATEITGTYIQANAISLLSYTAEAGEPGHRPNGNNGSQKSAWWKWTAPASGFCTVDTMTWSDTDYIHDTLLAVYTGSAVNDLTRVTRNDDTYAHLLYIAGNTSSVTFYAEEGTTYRIAVDGYSGSSITASVHRTRLRLRLLRSVPEAYYGAIGSFSEALGQGSVQFNKTAGHAFSGKLVIAGKAMPFKGVFSQDGLATLAFERKAAPGSAPLPPLTLQLDGAAGGWLNLVTAEDWYGSRLYNPKKFSPMQPNTMQGRHSAVISRAASQWTGGALTFTTTAKGTVVAAAVLPDGTKLTVGSWLCEKDASTCTVPLFSSLYKHKGFFMCNLLITENGQVDAVSADESVTSRYLRPENPGALFMPAGLSWSGSLTITGATYTPPAANTRALGFLNGTDGAGKLSLPLVNGELDPAILENLTFGTANSFAFSSNTRKPVLKLNKATGLVTGSVIDNGGLKRNLTGILFLDGMTPKLHGHASGTTKNVFFEVIP